MSLSVLDILAEQRIAEALRRGEFDHLPGAGRPLVFDDDALLSPELRMANRILKNAGVTPPEIGLRREIAALRRRLETLDGEDRARARRELGLLILRLGEMWRR